MPEVFRGDRAGIAALMVSETMAAAMRGIGADVAAEASRRAPKRTGTMADAYKVQPTTATIRTRFGISRRASGRVVNDNPHALAAEFGHAAPGGVVVPGTHTLGRLAGAKSAKTARRPA